MKADFRQVIKDFWFKAISSLDGQNKVVKAVSVLKDVLREWNKDSFGNIEDRIHVLET